VADRNSSSADNAATVRILLASSNAGKLREYIELAADSPLKFDLLPNFREIPLFEESAPTFAENGAGKAAYYSRFADGPVLAEDSGLVVSALGGAPGVYSARYVGPNATDADCVRKLLREMEGKQGDQRRARYVCVTAIARRGHVLAVVSDFVEGVIATEPRGTNGFGYDPIFFLPGLRQTYAETPPKVKNSQSHRAKAFRKVQNLFPL